MYHDLVQMLDTYTGTEYLLVLIQDHAPPWSASAKFHNSCAFVEFNHRGKFSNFYHHK
jgi:hypothetical protein